MFDSLPAILHASDDLRYWVGFRLAEVDSASRFQALLDAFGSLEAAWQADATQLRRVLGGRERTLSSVIRTRNKLDPDLVMERLERAGVSVVTVADDGYPRLLREIAAPPPVLFYKGQILETDSNAVAIVGTRRASAYGRDVAIDIAKGLAQAGVTVVSGLATGIDGHAHRASLDAGGRTFAVLGSGIHDIYPREHNGLAKRVAEQGALISDNLPDAKPDRWNFPARNRIISGLSLGVVVVEAPDKSGALITVDFAADQGRDVFAVPGMATSISSAGCNRILRDGARLVRSADDVLEDLRLRSQTGTVESQQPLILDDDERRILNVLTSEPRHIDDVVESCGMALPQVSGVLLTLELQQLVRNVGAQYYVRH
ncbi:MAG: DNA-processing protein DprA [Chloroflexota bacterium]|nr:DNA-processing protein DprA [Chloroflexota bacterium]